MSGIDFLSRLVGSRLRQERGQILTWLAISAVSVLGITGLVVDIGHVFNAHRELQASADAAALAGAQDLPDGSAAISRAYQYSSSSGQKNEKEDMPGVTTSVTTKCLTSTKIVCNPANAIMVEQKASVSTIFLKVLGVNSISIGAKAVASMKGGTAYPLDVMIVLDRTGSMCNPCTKIQNARAGVKAFLAAMRPSADKIGLAVLPPAPGTSWKCSNSSSSYYDTASNPYVVVPLLSDFRTSDTGPLNTSSDIVQTVDCLDTGGITSYATAIEKAQAELDANGRSDAQDVIIFFTDGEANYGPWYYGNGSTYRTNPCSQAVNSAAALKARGTWIYTIAYDTSTSVRCQGYRDSWGCRQGAATAFRCDEQPVITAYSALEQMASVIDGQSKFYDQPTAGELETIFERVAIDLSSVRLVDNDTT